MRPRDLKAARKRLGLTQEGLAKALGMSGVQVNRWENGASPVPKAIGLAVEALERRAAEGSKQRRPA